MTELLLHDGPRAAPVTVVLAHGAGAAMDSPFMQTVAERLGERGLHVVRFEFPYMRRRREAGGGGPPDATAVLLSAWRGLVAELGGGAQLVIGGKSMGGRMASMVADEVGARGLVCLGYPFHPPDKPEKLRTAHLRQLETRTLIVQGTRDTMGTREDVASYVLSASIRLCWIEDGDHSLKPRRKSGNTPEAAMSQAIDAITAFALGAGAGSG